MANSAKQEKNRKADGASSAIKENPGGHSRSEPLSLSKSLLSLEPALIIHMTSAIMVFMSISDLLLEKACRVNLAFSDEVCDALQARNTEGYEKQEEAVQTLMGQAVMVKTVIENAFPIFLVFLVGAWSDKYGRKYPMLFVILAFAVQDILLIGTVLAGNWAGMWTVTIVASLIVSLSGNQACFISCAFSYISDHTPVEKRTVRTGLTHSLIFFGITVGLAAGGVLAKLGFVKVFAIGIALEAFALAYLVISMKNQPRPGVTKGKTISQMFMELFDFQHIKDAGKCVFKKREGNTRLKLGLLLFAHACCFTPMMGEMAVLYLFCRLSFNWNAEIFGSWMAFKTVVSFVGNFISMGVLVGKLKLSDEQNGIVACVSNLLCALAFTMANSGTMMVIVPLLSLLGGAAMIVPRSMLSKIMPSEDMGKINSCIGSMESILPLVASAVYTMVYTSFLNVLPGSFFLISAALMVPPIFISLWFMQSDSKSASGKKKKQ